MEALGSAAGFVAVYRAESERVLVFCARRVLDAEAAVDLTAERFAQAYTRARRSAASAAAGRPSCRRPAEPRETRPGQRTR